MDMNVCSVTSVLCRTTPWWLVWMVARWQQPSTLTTGYFTSAYKCSDWRAASNRHRLRRGRPSVREMSAATDRHRQHSLDRGSGGAATFQPRRDNLV